MERDELPKEEAERRAREVAHKMLTTRKKPMPKGERQTPKTKKAKRSA